MQRFPTPTETFVRWKTNHSDGFNYMSFATNTRLFNIIRIFVNWTASCGESASKRNKKRRTFDKSHFRVFGKFNTHEEPSVWVYLFSRFSECTLCRISYSGCSLCHRFVNVHACFVIRWNIMELFKMLQFSASYFWGLNRIEFMWKSVFSINIY